MPIEEGRRLLARAKEQLRSRRARSFLDVAHQQLNRPPNDGIEWYQRAPHLLLLFAKWALASWRPNDGRSEPTEQEIGDLFQTTWDASGHLQRAEGNAAIFLRRMLLQQVWFQRRFDACAIARQYRIIGEHMAASDVAARFVQAIGMSPAQFAVQLAHMAADAGDHLEQDLLSVQRPLSPRDPQHWLRVQALYSKSIPDLHRVFVALEARGTPPEVEICEQSPLIRTPFILTRDRGPACLHHKLLYRTLESALFDMARSLDPRPFMNIFGPAFEQYVSEVLNDLNAEVIRERELMALLGGNGRVVDFALVSDDALILLDAKGIEGHYDELYHNLPSALAARLKTSLLRAVDQAVDTARRLPARLVRPEVYFICVTFKQVAVGDGEALRDLTRGTDEWEHARWQAPSLPPAHMLFASIYELESLVALAVARQLPLAHLIREFVQANSNPATAKALLEMHVMAQHVPLTAPQTVQEASERLRD